MTEGRPLNGINDGILNDLGLKRLPQHVYYNIEINIQTCSFKNPIKFALSQLIIQFNLMSIRLSIIKTTLIIKSTPLCYFVYLSM